MSLLDTYKDIISSVGKCCNQTYLLYHLLCFTQSAGHEKLVTRQSDFSDHKSIANCSKEIATYIISTKTNFKDNCLYE